MLKKQGVSGQSVAVSRDINITKHNKDFRSDSSPTICLLELPTKLDNVYSRSRTVIKEAIMENDFLKNLSQGQVTIQPTQHTSFKHYTLYITHYTLHIAHYTLHITHYTLHITHYTLHVTRYTLHIAHCTLHIVHYTVHMTHDT